MARARMLKPEFFSDKKVTRLNPWARLLFAGLWTIGDRDGRLKDNAKTIEGEIFPDERVNVERFLKDLALALLIIRYEIEGEHFIQITNFERHQHPHVNEAVSRIPPVPSTVQCTSQSTVLTRADNGLRITDSELRITGGAAEAAEPPEALPFEPVEKGRKRPLSQVEAEIPTLIDEFPGVNVPDQFIRFKDYNTSKNRTYTDYVAAFRNWLRKEQDYERERKQRPASNVRHPANRSLAGAGTAASSEAGWDAYKAGQGA